MDNNNLQKHIQKTLTTLTSCGVFITSGAAKPNVMTISWGAFGTLWNKPVFILPLRGSRFSYDIIDETGEFTISVPYEDMRKELHDSGTVSGRDVDKFTEFHLHAKKAREVDTFIVGDCQLHFECRVIYKSAMDGFQLDDSIKKEIYTNKNFHTMFYAEILDVYED